MAGGGDHRKATKIQSSKISLRGGSECWTSDGRGGNWRGIRRSRKPHGRDDRAILDSVPRLSRGGQMIPMKSKGEVWM